MVEQLREEGFYEAIEVPTTAVGSYQTVPRLQDRTAERHHGRFRGWSKELDVKMSKIFGARSSDIVKRIKKGVLSSSLNIARTFKVITK